MLPGANGMEAVLPRTNSRVLCLACGRRSIEAEFRACIASLVRLVNKLTRALDDTLMCRALAAQHGLTKIPWHDRPSCTKQVVTEEQTSESLAKTSLNLTGSSGL